MSARLDSPKQLCSPNFEKRLKSLVYYSKYKAVEFRQFLLHTGPVVGMVSSTIASIFISCFFTKILLARYAKQVEDYIRNCTNCQSRKISRNKTCEPILVEPLAKVALDTVGSFLTTPDGNSLLYEVPRRTMICCINQLREKFVGPTATMKK